MSKYTVKGSVDLDDKIDADLEHIRRAVSPFCEAGILLGGYGRGEGTPFILADGTQAPFNDYDLVVIVDRIDPAVKVHFQKLERTLTKELGLPVDLCPYARADLHSREFSLLNYEMKHGHQVLWGPDDILDAMPHYPHDSIPLSEGSRLLLNRGKLLLDIKQRLLTGQPLSDTERVCFIKFIRKAQLAFGDCALLAAGQYDISYAVKKERIEKIGNVPDRACIIESYRQAVALKEWGDYSVFESFEVSTELKHTSEIFLKFMAWYRAQYSGNECSLLKAVALNLRWHGRPLPRHPRLYLYDAVAELLKEDPDPRMLTQHLFSSDNHLERFYLLQRRFS